MKRTHRRKLPDKLTNHKLNDLDYGVRDAPRRGVSFRYAMLNA